MAILTAIAVFAQLDRGFDKIWRTPAKKGLSLQKTILNVLLHRCLASRCCLRSAEWSSFCLLLSLVVAQVKTRLFEQLNVWFGVTEPGAWLPVQRFSIYLRHYRQCVAFRDGL